jgi:osmoprotectant transport system substrate-binding protein
MKISFQSRGNATRCRAHLSDSRSPLYVSILLTWLILVTSCAPSHSDRVVVGSKNFTESLILGELMAQQIEAHSGVKVERRFYLAGTYICHQAVLAGRIDIYPEYTGTALSAILKQAAGGDRAAVYQRVKHAYERLGLTLGPGFGFNDTFAMEVRGEDDHQIDLAAGNTTDGLIPALDLFVLADDRHYFPPYEAVPVIREQTLRLHPEVSEALAALAGKISDQEMQRLNYAVDGQHRDVKDVVREFLQGKELIH